MKKLIKYMVLPAAFIPLCSFAALVHVTGDRFVEDGMNIIYPCSVGGEPLIIYGTPINNHSNISSKETINPIYIKNGFQAKPFTISLPAQSDAKATAYLITQSPNPGNIDTFVRFGLQKTDNTSFYVNSVNFATVHSAGNQDKFVSAFAITGDNNEHLYQSLFPSQEFSFAEDTGVAIFKDVQTISANQYSWSQNTDWRDYNHLNATSVNHYNFTPVLAQPNFYDGFGFWICGSDQTSKQANATHKLANQIYHDRINQQAGKQA